MIIIIQDLGTFCAENWIKQCLILGREGGDGGGLKNYFL